MSDDGRRIYLIQLAQLKAGLKRGALLSGGEAVVRAAAAAFSEHGFGCVSLSPHEAQAAGFDGREAWLFAGPDAAAAEKTRDLYVAQRRVLNAGEDAAAITREVGAQLGYPACCTEAFLKLVRNTDRYLVRGAWYRTVGRVEPLCLFLGRQAPTLLQHAPCSFNCEASAAIAAATLAELKSLDAGFAGHTEACLQAPLLFVDERRYLRLNDAVFEDGGVRFSGFLAKPEELALLNADWLKALEGARRLIRSHEGAWQVETQSGELRPLADPRSPVLPIFIRPGETTPFTMPVGAAIIESFPNEAAQALSSFFPRLYAGDLAENGMATGWWHVHQRPGDESANAHLHAELAGQVAARGLLQSFWFRSYADGAAQAVADRVPAGLRVLVDNTSPTRAAKMTHGMAIVDRTRFIQAVLGVAGNRAPEWLHAQSDPSPVWSAAETLLPPPILVDPAHPLSNAVAPTRINPSVTRPPDVLEIAAVAGCPYGARCDANPEFAGLDLSAFPYRRGCSYCTTRPPVRPVVKRTDALASLVFQVERAKQNGQLGERVRILDQGVLALLPDFLAACARLDLPPVSWLLDLRVTELLAGREALEAALKQAEAMGHTLDLFCIGFENFSPAELLRFNKGATADQNRAAVALIDELSEAHPAAVSGETAASGFILFTPWTTPADLRANAEAMQALDFARFRREALFTKLRLYRDTPLFALAKRDGLLADDFDDAWAETAARTGYSPEEPWRFTNEKTAWIFEALQVLTRQPGRLDEPAALRLALDAAETATGPHEIATALEAARERLVAADSPANDARQNAGDDLTRRLDIPERLVAALSDAEENVSKKPSDFAARMLLAGLYVSVNRLDDALAQFLAARRLNPTHADPLVRIGELLAKTGRSAEARRVLRAALGQFAGRPEAALIAKTLESL